MLTPLPASSTPSLGHLHLQQLEGAEIQGQSQWNICEVLRVAAQLRRSLVRGCQAGDVLRVPQPLPVRGCAPRTAAA